MNKREDNVHVGRFGPDGAPADSRESVAAVLRRARENHGQDVRSVAQVLRIRQAYLEALESGSFDKLPGTAYALGFLRTYAEYLGLNANNIVDRFKDEAKAPEQRTELIFPEPVAEGRIPGGAIILISVTLLAVAYGGWFYMTNQGRSVADLIPGMPEQIQTLVDDENVEPVAPVETPIQAVSEDPPAKSTQMAAPPLAKPDPVFETVAEPVVEAAAEPAEAPSAAVAQSDPVETEAVPAPAAAAPQVQDSAPVRDPRPAQSTQVAALPTDNEFTDNSPKVDTAGVTATGVSEGPPISSEPAPELASLNRAETLADAQASTQEAEIGEPTVVIPAPPSAPQDFAPLGERAPQVYGEGNQDSRIVLRALQDSWVQVRDRQDGLLLTRVLRSGDTYRVPDQAGLTLLTGNAGGIELEVDGIRLAPLGPIGAVRRQIALDPSILLNQDSRQ